MIGVYSSIKTVFNLFSVRIVNKSVRLVYTESRGVTVSMWGKTQRKNKAKRKVIFKL